MIDIGTETVILLHLRAEESAEVLLGLAKYSSWKSVGEDHRKPAKGGLPNVLFVLRR